MTQLNEEELTNQCKWCQKKPGGCKRHSSKMTVTIEETYFMSKSKIDSLLAQQRNELIDECIEIIDKETEYPSRIWSKSLEDVELGIALDGLETYKRELTEKLESLKGKKD